MTPDAWFWIVVAFLAAVGGVIGSFLNVVVHRAPAGLSVVSPGSHCPACQHPIRWHDNVPVLGWFLVRGRCRDCRAAVSWRYPAVEAAVGGLFVLLGVFEFLSAGANLPDRPMAVPGGMIVASMTAREAAAVYVHHLVLCCTLLAAALVEYDRGRAACASLTRLYLPAVVWGVAAPLAWPYVHPAPAFGPAVGWLAGLIDSAAGAGAGALLGAAAAVVFGSVCRDRPAHGPSAPAVPEGLLARGGFCPCVAASAATGLYLGWQAALALVGAGAVLHLAQCLGARRWHGPLARIPFSAWLALGSPAWVLAWRGLADWWRG